MECVVGSPVSQGSRLPGSGEGGGGREEEEWVEASAHLQRNWHQILELSSADCVAFACDTLFPANSSPARPAPRAPRFTTPLPADCIVYGAAVSHDASANPPAPRD